MKAPLHRRRSSGGSALESAGLWARISFSWVTPLIRKSWANITLAAGDAAFLQPAVDDAPALTGQFEAAYAANKERYAGRAKQPNLTTITLLQLYWPTLIWHSFWVLMEIAIRLLSPVALRQFLRWLQASAAAPAATPVWPGWVWAACVAAGGVSMTLVHHQFFWIGMRMGFRMRQQVVAAIHAKVLRLNSASVAHANAGKIVNMASNDVRRFDDNCFWLFTWAGPLEGGLVLMMVSLELGFVPAICGMAAMLSVIPMQALLVRTIAGLRRNAASRTDERVSLTGEVIQGCLAMKMLGWEAPFTAAINAIRAKEVVFSGRMAQIRGLNITLQFCMTPVVAFITFSVYRAMYGTLYLPSVFYALSLMHLPKLYMLYFAVLGFQNLTETFVAVQRIDRFLLMPEPPPPVHMQGTPAPEAAAAAAGAPGRASGAAAAVELVGSNSAAAAGAAATGGSGNGGKVASLLPLDQQQQQQKQQCDLPDGYVELGGADYDWNTNVEEMAAQDPSHRPQQAPPQLTASATQAAAAAGSSSSAATAPPPPAAAASADGRGSLSLDGGGSGLSSGLLRTTLTGVRLVVQPGELVAIVGEVGGGKSSLLAALLGELMPTRGADGLVHGGPVVVGKLAYCSQVPWIMAASLRENIVFQMPFDKERYSAVIDACALRQDLSELPAGDMTELGERGINLSGGQKARVALARAAYSAASVQLLDDPLSAVDPRVGRVLFERCIGPGGLMAGATRLLVTHQRQYLHKCDRIVVLRGGVLVAAGSWQEVAALQLPEIVARAVTGDVMTSQTAVEEEEEQGAAEDGQQQASAAGEQQQLVNGSSTLQTLTSFNEQRQQQQCVAAAAAAPGGAGGSSGSGVLGSSSSAGSDDDDGGLAGMLSRIRTMPPDINRRPADSGAVRNGISNGVSNGSWGGSWGGWLGSRGSGIFRAVSRSFSRGFSFAGGSADAAAAANGKGHVVQQEGYGIEAAGGSSWARLRARGGYALASVFTPPAFLPGGKFFVTPAAAAAAKAGGKQQLQSLPSSAAAGAAAGQLVETERRETGSVSWGVYGAYCRQLGTLMSCALLAALVAGQGVFLAAEWWLSLWSAAPPADQGNSRWLTVYGCLTAGVICLCLLRSGVFFWATIRAATKMHNTMLLRVLRAPLSFFHTNPAGRVLNRFSNDLGRVDDVLPMVLFDALQTGFFCFGAIVLMAVAVPFMIPVFAALMVAFYYFRQRYITTSREVKRWDATSRSPVYASFSATLKGLPTIRAYGAERRFQDVFIQHLSLNGQWWFAYLATSRWIGFRLDVIATTTLAGTLLMAMLLRERVAATILALALSQLLQLTGTLQWWTRQTVEVENNMTCVERMVEYTRLPQEPPRLAEGGKRPPPGWPSSGAVTYSNVTASYRPGLPAVLTGLSFSLPPGCSCGVVGRTGSGKSSLMLTLFRLIDINAGSIFLDGVDTSTIALDCLRRQLAIIPQDPVLFSGTLRSNLDPWNQHDDASLWRALRTVQLRPAIKAAGGLHVRMAEAGDNLSVGQRQLFCLARALLQEARVLALDEATANVDRSTDALIQQALGEFAGGETGRALLVIAHRIDTIMDCDHLLVLSNGVLVEQGKPSELAAAPATADGSNPGVFASMVAAAKAASAGHHH